MNDLTKIRCFEVTANGSLVPIELSDNLSAWHRDDTVRWIDVEGESDLSYFLDSFDIHPLPRERYLEKRRTTTLFYYGATLYGELPYYSKIKKQRRHYLSLFCLKNTLITHHRKPLPFLTEFIEDYTEGQVLLGSGIEFLLSAFVERFGDSLLEKFLKLRDQVDDLGKEIFEGKKEAPVKRILGLKRQINIMGAISEGHFYFLSLLKNKVSGPFDFIKVKSYLKDLTISCDHTNEAIEKLANRLQDYHHHYELFIQKKTEARLNLLAILSSIFMPLTLISSIYGMNFSNMPELKLYYAYPVVLLFMLTIALCMVFFFRSKGWFK